jgi:hypothetical protein
LSSATCGCALGDKLSFDVLVVGTLGVTFETPAALGSTIVLMSRESHNDLDPKLLVVNIVFDLPSGAGCYSFYVTRFSICLLGEY